MFFIYFKNKNSQKIMVLLISISETTSLDQENDFIVPPA